MMVDKFSKFVKYIVLHSQIAETTSKAFVIHFPSRLGYRNSFFSYLFQIITDQGTKNFKVFFSKHCVNV